jgi:hypothetical protein
MIAVRSLRSRPGAASAATLWLLGTIVLPALHLAHHARPHDHEGGGIHYHVGKEAGRDDHDDDGDEPGGPSTVEAPHHHGHSHRDAGLAHFAAATGEGATAQRVLSSESDPERVLDALANRHVPFLSVGKRAARAPPKS